MVKKVVVIGPESTGKSTLCKQLAKHFDTEWVPEYARAYLEINGSKYNYEDLSLIAVGQLTLEEATLTNLIPAEKDQFVFMDTNLHVIKIWSEFVFNSCDNWILTQIAERQYDLYLLCDIDLPWVQDGLREYPDAYTRLKLFHMYKDVLVNQDVPWAEIKGNYDERLQSAIEKIEAMLT